MIIAGIIVKAKAKVIGTTDKGNQVETLDEVIGVVATLEEIEKDKEGTIGSKKEIGETKAEIEEVITIEMTIVEIIETTTGNKVNGPMVTGNNVVWPQINLKLISECFLAKTKYYLRPIKNKCST